VARTLRGEVAAGERHPRTLEAHCYQLDRHLRPALGRRRAAALTVDDVAELLHELRRSGRSAKTAAGALATLQSVMRFARRCGWIVADPVERLEHDERPRPQRCRQRVLGRTEMERLLAACSPRDRLMLATVLYTGLRISEMLGLVWDDVDFAAGVIHVRAQLSRAHRDAPAQRVAPKTPASVRDVPLVAQLARLLSAHKLRSPIRARRRLGVRDRARHPHGHRNVSRRTLGRAAQLAGLDDDGWPPLRFHDLRHRVKILNALLAAGGEAVCVCDFEELIGLKQPTVSYHLKQLLTAVRGRRPAPTRTAVARSSDLWTPGRIPKQAASTAPSRCSWSRWQR
jgi:integrase